jgi:hypothetical protein
MQGKKLTKYQEYTQNREIKNLNYGSKNYERIFIQKNLKSIRLLILE